MELMTEHDWEQRSAERKRFIDGQISVHISASDNGNNDVVSQFVRNDMWDAVVLSMRMKGYTPVPLSEVVYFPSMFRQGLFSKPKVK